MKSRLTLGCVALIGLAFCASPLAATQLLVGSYQLNKHDDNEIHSYGLATTDLSYKTSSGGLHTPRAGVIGPDGNLYVTSIAKGEILRYNPATGDFIDIFADSGDGLTGPNGMALGPDGNFYVANSVMGGELRKIDGTTGEDLGVFATSPPNLMDPKREFSDVVFGPDFGEPSANGFDLYISTGAAGSNPGPGRGVFRYNGSTGSEESRIIDSTTQPGPLLVGDDYLYIGDQRGGGNPRLLRYEWSSGTLSVLVDSTEGDAAGLSNVTGLAFDANGDLLASSFNATPDAVGDKVARMNINTGAYIDDFAIVENPTFLTPFTPTGTTGIPGDFNANGIVDAADYTIWRDGNSSDSTTAGYALWVANFGQSTASGSGADHIPEPTTLLLTLLALTAVPLRVWHG